MIHELKFNDRLKNHNRGEMMFVIFNKAQFSFFYRFLLMMLFAIFAVEGCEECSDLTRSLTINIIGYQNRAGLTKDIETLTEELSKLGHSVEFVDYRETPSRAKVDINIFLFAYFETEYLFTFADKNYLIPNPEWCKPTDEKWVQFDMILCKTREAERIFKPIHPHTVFMGFTCKDCFDPTIPKDYKSLFHVMGAQKGSEAICEAWQNNPDLPLLKIINYKKKYKPAIPHIDFVNYRLSEEEVKILRNSYGMHLCPSKTEGFGHSLSEALCCEAVMVTTNAPPMNEFVFDPRCLVNYKDTVQWSLATAYSPDPDHLGSIIVDLLNLPEEELREMGRKNRELYLKNDQFFKQRLKDIFK